MGIVAHHLASDASGRDRALRRLHRARWAIGAAAAGLTALLSITAADAFRGHTGSGKVVSAPVRRRAQPPVRVTVPRPQGVPAIVGSPAPLQPPAAPPAAAPPPPAPTPAAPVPAPQVSGGS